MAITPYNLKLNAYVTANASGTYGSSLNKTTKKATALQKYNKSTKIGQLTGGVQTVTISGKSYEMVEVLLTNPVKPNFLTTYYRLWFQSANLDIVTEKAPKANIPPKVVKKAEAKVVTKKATTKTTTPTTPTPTNPEYPDYYNEVVEKETDWTVVIIGALLLALALFMAFRAFKKKRLMKLMEKRSGNSKSGKPIEGSDLKLLN